MTEHLHEHIARDNWLSAVTGKDCYHIRAASCNPYGRCGTELSTDLDRLASRGVFISAGVPDDDPSMAGFLMDRGFRFMGRSVYYAKAVAAGPKGVKDAVRCRLARPGDRPRVAEIAERSFTCSRFHADEAVGAELSGRIHAAWAGSWFGGTRGDCMLVAPDGGPVDGFMLLIVRNAVTIVVDLVAVDETRRRNGIGSALLRQAEGMFPRHGTLVAGTQERNEAACRLYEGAGFLVRAVKRMYHFHSGQNPYS